MVLGHSVVAGQNLKEGAKDLLVEALLAMDCGR